jgi:hypothetical protein
MADPLGSHDFAYVHSDIPAGMTIRGWKRDRAAARAIERRPERGTRRNQLVSRAASWRAREWPGRAGASLRVLRGRRRTSRGGQA